MRHPAFAAVSIALIAAAATADRIIIDGVAHEGVYLRESETLYYVQFPETGRTMAVDKAKIDPASVVIDAAVAAREALLERWHAARGSRPALAPASKPAPAPPAARGAGAVAAPKAGSNPAPAREDGGNPRSGGRVDYVRLEDVPLGEALRATLRPMGLDYAVQGEYLYVSTPERLRRESFEPIETRVYRVQNDHAALPKIVLRNTAGGNFSGGGIGGGSIGGVGRGGFTGAGGIGNNNRGFAGNNFGGGFGNQGFGGRGAGFGGSDVTQISNISDMFSTIDDALVGEPPATIGISAAAPR